MQKLPTVLLAGVCLAIKFHSSREEGYPDKYFSYFSTNIGIKHGFSCINIRQVPREVLKTEVGGRGFQHLPKELVNDNALKNHV